MRETSKQKSYIVCDNCGVQIFARGPKSDRILRGMVDAEGDKVAGVGGSGGGAAGLDDGEVCRASDKLDGGKVGRGSANATIQEAKKPAPGIFAQQAAPAPGVMRTAEGERRPAIAPAVPELTIFDHIAGLMK